MGFGPLIPNSQNYDLHLACAAVTHSTAVPIQRAFLLSILEQGLPPYPSVRSARDGSRPISSGKSNRLLRRCYGECAWWAADNEISSRVACPKSARQRELCGLRSAPADFTSLRVLLLFALARAAGAGAWTVIDRRIAGRLGIDAVTDAIVALSAIPAGRRDCGRRQRGRKKHCHGRRNGQRVLAAVGQKRPSIGFHFTVRFGSRFLHKLHSNEKDGGSA